MISYKFTSIPMPYIPIEKRAELLPARNICCIFPGAEPADYLETGNGSLKLNVSGQPYQEEMAFTQEMIYEPLWKNTPLPPDLRPYMSEIRQHLMNNEPEKTDALIDRAQREAGFEKYMNFDKPIVYPVGSPRRHTAFWLNFRQPKQERTWDYLRWLNMRNGLISSIWTTVDGTYRTESFASCSQNLFLNRLSGPEGKLNVDISMDAPGRPVMFGYMKMEQPFTGSSHHLRIHENGFDLEWAYNPDFGQKGYNAVVRIFPQGGTMQKTEVGLSIRNASSILVVSRIVKYEEDYHFGGSEMIGNTLNAAFDFDSLLAENEAVIGEKMDRSHITLASKEDLLLSGEELLARVHSKNSLDPALLEKLYDLGRFFQIYDTGKLPPMTGQHNINTNLQVCAGNNTGLFDEMDVYFRYYEDKFEDFRTNARLLFNARGLLASVHCDPDSGLFYHFSKTYPHYCWTGCLGWIYNELWGYYLVTNDRDFLRDRVIPALKEIALFYEDYACDRDADGKSIFYPSFSPENPTPNPGYETVTCKSIHPTRINSVMDIAICREVLTNLIEGCKTLQIEAEMIPHWEEQLNALPYYLLDEEGALKEWAWESVEENYNHRHVSHHYDVWPGRAITPETEPELSRAILLSNRKRGQQDDSAHGIIHRAFTAIRLKDQEEFLQNMSQLLCHGFVRNTLSTNHFPYRGIFPDLLGAAPALLIEMSVFSTPGIVEFLPMMPDPLTEGKIEGVWLYTFAKLEYMTWTSHSLQAKLISRKDQKLLLRCRRKGAEISVNGTLLPMEGDHAFYQMKEDEAISVSVEF